MSSHLMMLLFGGDPGEQVINVEYLVVGGGGGGGKAAPGPLDEIRTGGGGGGAGGVLAGTLPVTPGETKTISVGNGGVPQGDGSDSVFGDLTAIGGGAGGTGGESPQNGRPGGSGGGGAQTLTGTTSGGAGADGQGSSGQGGSSNFAGLGGGANLSSAITGTTVAYGVGGTSGDESSLPTNTGNGGGGSGGVLVGILVSDAGQEDVNGLYTVSGTSLLDSPEYRLGETDFYIRNDASNWNIVFDDGVNPSEVLYRLNNTPADPEFYEPYVGPLPEGPATAINGDEPAPGIADGFGETSAVTGSDGVVILAIPAAAVVTITGTSYTVDTGARPGLAVYKFTAGSGAITFL